MDWEVYIKQLEEQNIEANRMLLTFRKFQTEHPGFELYIANEAEKIRLNKLLIKMAKTKLGEQSFKG